MPCGLATPFSSSKQYLEFKWNRHTGLSAHLCATHMSQNAILICNKLTPNGKERTGTIAVGKRKSMTTHCRNWYYNMGQIAS